MNFINWEDEEVSIYLSNHTIRMSKTQYINYLAIQMLEEVLGNVCPLQDEIDEIEAYLRKLCGRKVKKNINKSLSKAKTKMLSQS